MAMRAVRIGESLPERTLRSRRVYTWFSMFDTHCHLTFDCYESRISQVLADAKKAGVRGCITVATTTAAVCPSLQAWPSGEMPSG